MSLSPEQEKAFAIELAAAMPPAFCSKCERELYNPGLDITAAEKAVRRVENAMAIVRQVTLTLYDSASQIESADAGRCAEMLSGAYDLLNQAAGVLAPAAQKLAVSERQQRRDD